MTDRIQELSKQARKYAQQYVNESVIPYGKTASEFERIFESKFAELIVRECMGVARGMRNPPNLNYKPSDRFVDELRLHFGVEE